MADESVGGRLIFMERSCFDCVHHQDVADENGWISSWCELWEQPIDSEAYEAEDCSTYERNNNYGKGK